MKNITKMNYPHNKGYWVRFYSHRKLVAHKSFPLGRYDNDWDQTLIAARSWRDEQIRSNPAVQEIINSTSKGYRNKPPRNNRSGVVGVHDSHEYHGRDRVRIPYSMATGVIQGKKITDKFYWHHSTPEKARTLAIARRKEIEATLDAIR